MTAEKVEDVQRELESTKWQLNNANAELTKYKSLAVKQTEAINELEVTLIHFDKYSVT